LFFFCVKKGDCIRLLFLFCLLVLMMMEILAYVCACALERERWKNWKSDQDSRLLGQLSWPPHLTNDFSGHFFRTRMEQLSPCSLPCPSPPLTSSVWPFLSFSFQSPCASIWIGVCVRILMTALSFRPHCDFRSCTAPIFQDSGTWT